MMDLRYIIYVTDLDRDCFFLVIQNFKCYEFAYGDERYLLTLDEDGSRLKNL